MLDAKRGLLAECTKNGHRCSLYKHGYADYFMYTPSFPSSSIIGVETDKDAIECFAKYCGVSVENIVA